MQGRLHPPVWFSSCQGPGLWLARSSPAAGSGPLGRRDTDDHWGAATLLAEEEAEHGSIPLLGVRVGSPWDLPWAEAVLGWAHAHGRRALLRTPLIPSRSLARALRQGGATVLLEIAHGRRDLQRALLGRHADGAAGLLLHAQYLRSLEIPVAVHLGPLFPGLHDQPGVVAGLARHMSAARVDAAHLSVGRLAPGRLEALGRVLGAVGVARLRRAFAVDDPARLAPWRLSAVSESALFHGVRRQVEQEGVTVDGCGCPAQCHLDRGPPRAYVPIAARELFGSAS